MTSGIRMATKNIKFHEIWCAKSERHIIKGTLSESLLFFKASLLSRLIPY